MHEVAVELASFNGQRRPPGSGGERFEFVLLIAFRRVERREERTQRQPGAGVDLTADDAQAFLAGRRMSETRSVIYVAPAGRAIQNERHHLRDVLNDVCQRL